MKRRSYLASITALTGVSLAGCSGGDTEGRDETQPTATPSPTESGGASTPRGSGDDETTRTESEQSEAGTATEEPTPEVAEDIPPQSFSGSGAAVEAGIDIAGGLVVVDAEHTGGSSNFQVTLVPSLGQYDELFVNEIGEYDGETAALIDADTYTLDVEADGNWNVEIRQPRANSGESLPASLDGDRNVVDGPFEFGGSHVASGSHSGQSNFQVFVYPPEGDFGELVFNETGEYEGETTFRHSGVGWIAVVGDGDWTVEVE